MERPVVHGQAIFVAAAWIAACADSTSPKPTQFRGGELVAYELDVEVDVPHGTMTIRQAKDGQSASGLTSVSVVQDGVPGSGPPDTVEFVTELSSTDSDVCGGPARFCGRVRLNSFHGMDLVEGHVEILNIIPATGHLLLGSSAPPPGLKLKTTFGVIRYGKIPAGGSRAQTWTFENLDGTSFRFRARFVAQLIPTGILDSASKGSSIAVNDSESVGAVVAKDSDMVAIASAIDMSPVATVPVGDEPNALCFHPNGSDLFVVNRADGTLSRIRNADSPLAHVDATVFTGSEASQCALSPGGSRIFVSNWADGTVAVVDSSSMTVSSVLFIGGAPYGVCVSNDFDQDESDETAYVTDFYARPIVGGREADDEGKVGHVTTIQVSDLTTGSLVLPPLADAAIAAVPGTGAFANQLYSCAISAGKVFFTAVGASPESFSGGTDFRQNLQGLLYVFDHATGVHERTININSLVDLQVAPRRFASVPIDLAFENNFSGRAWVASTLSNSILAVNALDASPSAAVPGGPNFLDAGSSPSGVAASSRMAVVNNEVARTVSVFNLDSQTKITDLAYAAAPSPGSPEDLRLRGNRFFNTGQARWSTGAWVGCVGCHPFGTTDNVTWSFPAGPRQTVDTSATFPSDGTTQRILNWTAIFDEIHDFELNTRGVANGVGAIVSSTTLDVSSRIDFVSSNNGFNLGSSKAVNDSQGVLNDWDEIHDYVASIRAPRGRSTLATTGDPSNGRAVFEGGGCNNCHGGALWTLSERYYTPQLGQDNRTVTLADAGVGTIAIDAALMPRGLTDPSLLFVLENDGNGAPQRHTCVVRRVGTFAALGPGGQGATEVRQNGPAAQGVDGFNVPSLLGVNMGAPYLHNGAAASLEELLDPAGSFATHLVAGNPAFNPSATDIADLISFLRTIDDTTATIAVPALNQICPTTL
ncbi:MAG: hypothetical protein HYV07_08130 [Deltaproteobacteria bacterium]|nr:hypothetical protein [Deltaproteobacteria bacterium]